MPCTSTFLSLKNKIDLSNRASGHCNRNLYIIQEQASIDEVYEQYQCPCPGSCTCKHYGCERHWRLKSGLTFDQFCDAYLRMFVDRNLHGSILDALRHGRAIGGRARRPLPFLQAAKNSWGVWLHQARATAPTLVCDNWRPDFWVTLWANWEASVYWAKLWAMLLPDLAIPYDFDSLKKIRSCTGGSPPQYSDMLEHLRKEVIALLSREKRSLAEFRMLDNPTLAGLQFNHNKIRIKRQGFQYSPSFAPVDRPLSRVIDKCFYSP